WAVTLLGAAMTRLRSQYEIQGKLAIFESLKAFLDPAKSSEPLSYEQAASALGGGLGAAKTLIHRLRKQDSALVREEIARTVSDRREVDQAIHALCQALIAAEGRCYAMTPGESTGEAEQPPAAPHRLCRICGTTLVTSNSTEFCPVCVLRSVLEAKSELPAPERDLERGAPPSAAHQFEHYRLVLNEDGSPVEL